VMFRGSPIKRIGRDRFVRNVLIAIGNSGDHGLRPVAAHLQSDPNDVVAEAAEWASERLRSADQPTEADRGPPTHVRYPCRDAPSSTAASPIANTTSRLPHPRSRS
jgi:hypothetical protein